MSYNLLRSLSNFDILNSIYVYQVELIFPLVSNNCQVMQLKRNEMHKISCYFLWLMT